MRWAIKDKISKSTVDKFIKYLDYIAEVLKQAQEKLLIRQGLQTNRLAYVLASMLNAVIFPWLKEDCKKEGITDMANFILDIFFNGVERK